MAKLLNRYEKVAAASEAVLQRGFGVNGEIAQELSDALEELRK